MGLDRFFQRVMTTSLDMRRKWFAGGNPDPLEEGWNLAKMIDGPTGCWRALNRFTELSAIHFSSGE